MNRAERRRRLEVIRTVRRDDYRKARANGSTRTLAWLWSYFNTRSVDWPFTGWR